MFGGPGDPGTGSTGYRGDNLYQKPDSFAELSNNPGAGVHGDFSALGNLPYGTPVTVTNPANGRSMTLYKRDVGAGGSGINGTPRAIDLWYSAAQKLGINGLGVVKVTIGGKPGQVPQAPSKGGGGGSNAQIPGITTTTSNLTVGVPQQQFDQAGFDKANAKYIAGTYLSQTSRSNPWEQGSPKNTGFGGTSMIAPGLLSTTAPNPQDYLSTTIKNETFRLAHSSLNQIAGGGVQPHPAANSPTGPNVNPLPAGWSLSRTDQGVDASAQPGTPIRAINDSKVVFVDHSWYAGQPQVVLQLTSGPDKGKYWYVAEQITDPNGGRGWHVGQFFPRNSTVAKYAPSGTGIEIGWGSMSSGGHTLAQQTGQTGDATAGNAPAGIAFRKQFFGGR